MGVALNFSLKMFAVLFWFVTVKWIHRKICRGAAGPRRVGVSAKLLKNTKRAMNRPTEYTANNDGIFKLSNLSLFVPFIKEYQYKRIKMIKVKCNEWWWNMWALRHTPNTLNPYIHFILCTFDSFIVSITEWLIHSCIYSINHSLTYLFIHSSIHSFLHSFRAKP